MKRGLKPHEDAHLPIAKSGCIELPTTNMEPSSAKTPLGHSLGKCSASHIELSGCAEQPQHPRIPVDPAFNRFSEFVSMVHVVTRPRRPLCVDSPVPSVPRFHPIQVSYFVTSKWSSQFSRLCTCEPCYGHGHGRFNDFNVNDRTMGIGVAGLHSRTANQARLLRQTMSDEAIGCDERAGLISGRHLRRDFL